MRRVLGRGLRTVRGIRRSAIVGGIGRSPGWVRKRFENRAAVLMYHGVCEVDIDPWGLFVSPANFEEHLQVLAERAVTVDLGALATGQVRSGAVAVTFDDGYGNVLHRAKPLLESYGVPATVFAISGPLDGPTEYWWDELAGIVLRPGRLPVRLDQRSFPGPAIDLGPAECYSAAQWSVDHRYRDEEMPAGPRMALYRDLWQRLLHIDDGRRRAALDGLAAWADVPVGPRASHRNVSVEELVELDGGVVTVGGHTMTHPLLPEVPADRRLAEIVDNKAHLEDLLGRPVDAFSYPFGAHDDASVAAVRHCGYRLAVTTRPSTTTGSTDPLRIGRFDVKDWTGEEFERRLCRWMRYR